MIISILSFFILVILGHYFAWYLSLAACPRLKMKKYWLLAIYISITVIFLGSFAYLHQSISPIFAYIYVTSAVLFGLLSQLMLLGTFYYLLITISKSLSSLKVFLEKYQSRFAQALIVLALCLFVLGTYNAFFPHVKNINLDNWPEELKGKSVVHLSDLHLGAIYRPAYLNRIVNQVNALNADLIIISGDLFDGSDEFLPEFIEPLSNFSAPTIFVPGNHDTYVTNNEVERTVLTAGLINLVDSALIVDGIKVIGFNYSGRADSEQRRVIDNLEEGTGLAEIVVNHVPVDQAEAKALGADLMLSGHTHRGQIFPFSIVINLLYGRFAYGLEDYEGMSVYTSAGTGTWGPPLRTLFPGEIIKFNLR
ncbi:MAG: metallophosphoesterase [Patescibacteria group bacterium]|nr:metallophosphoesterase [Patescibacteria group bacterium]